MTLGAFNNAGRTRVSGRFDLEGYLVPQPTPGLIQTGQHSLFNPRLTLFLDSQIGPYLYLFVQSRVDRGFDPADRSVEARADEYALRYTPWEEGTLNVQVGKFATVVGNWVGRHQSWENPFVTAPLPYENVTNIYDAWAPRRTRDFTSGRYNASYEYVPVIWGPSYASGVSVSGRLGQFDYAAEIKNSAVSSPPEMWDATDVGFDYPTVSGRLGFRPNPMWNLGVSISNGPYFQSAAQSTLPRGTGIGDYNELVVGQDIGFAWHHLEVWAEFYEVRFDMPRVGNADSLGYYLEARYHFTPQLFGSLRWNEQLFGTVPDGFGGYVQWDNDVWRADAAIGYRFTAHTQLKLQYSLQRQNSEYGNFSHLFAAQFTVRF